MMIEHSERKWKSIRQFFGIQPYGTNQTRIKGKRSPEGQGLVQPCEEMIVDQLIIPKEGRLDPGISNIYDQISPHARKINIIKKSNFQALNLSLNSLFT